MGKVPTEFKVQIKDAFPKPVLAKHVNCSLKATTSQ